MPFPIAQEIYDNTYNGGHDAFVSKFDNNLSIDTSASQGSDLIGEWITLKSKKKGPKYIVNARIKIKNEGNEDAESCIVKFYLSEDDLFDKDDILFKKVKTGNVKAGKSVRKRLFYSFHLNKRPQGKYVIAVIDANGEIAETNENNNEVANVPH